MLKGMVEFLSKSESRRTRSITRFIMRLPVSLYTLVHTKVNWPHVLLFVPESELSLLIKYVYLNKIKYKN